MAVLAFNKEIWLAQMECMCREQTPASTDFRKRLS